MHPAHRVEQERYAIILAGGDATRLMPLTRRITGRPVPKQFCPVVGGSTLLAQTQRRVALGISPKRTVLVLNRQHESFYSDQIGNVPESRLVLQPANRGTAPAILFALLRLAKLSPHAVVTVFPSDHHVDDGRRFMSYADSAMHAAALRSNQLVLLAIQPDRAESGYGWIEPDRSLEKGSELLRVGRFWEKPPKLFAQELWRRGCLWNSFVIAGKVRAFFSMIALALPELRRAFGPAWTSLGTPHEQAVIERVYANLPSSDFCKDLLAQLPRSLMALPVEGVYWNDLGDSRRVYETLARTQIRPNWMSKRATRSRNDFVRHIFPRMARVEERAFPYEPRDR